IRDAFPHGRYLPRIEAQDFRLTDHRQDATEWKRQQQKAFLEERERWGADKFVELADSIAPAAEDSVPEGCRALSSPVTANVWSIGVEPGQRVDGGQRLMVREAMKMEIAVTAPVSGVLGKSVDLGGRRII